MGLSAPYDRGLNDGHHDHGWEAGGHAGWIEPRLRHAGLFLDACAFRCWRDDQSRMRDTSTSQLIAVVNEDFARKFFHDPAPIGRHFKLNDTGDPVFTIVGVVGNVMKRPGMERDAPIATEPVFYLPAAQIPQGLVNVAHIWFQPSWIVRTSGPVDGTDGVDAAGAG